MLSVPAFAAGQSTMERTPNLTGGWSGNAGTGYFHFLHRFQRTAAPARKVINSPTFLLGYAPVSPLLVGLNYATSSRVASNYPNEWEVFGRVRVLSGDRPINASLQAGYNEAARSVDGALDVSRSIGRVRVLGTVRAFSDAYGGDGALAAGGGAMLTLGPVAVGGDIVRVLDGSQDAAWSGALQWRIPYSPHTISLHATNAATGTLQGASRGETGTSYGFEFTVPITLARYLGGGARAAAAPAGADSAAPATPARAPAADAAEVVTVVIRNLAFGQQRVEVAPGTLVRWVNEDPVEHTVTDDRGRFDSGLIRAGGGVYERRFTEAGEYAYHCTPHPFMKAVVVVRGSTESGS
jgi:plastocyanin